MADKGVKKIALNAGSTYYPKMGGGSVLVIPGGTKMGFHVSEWFPDTPDADKNKVTWILQDGRRTEIIVQYQGSGPKLNNFSISKKLSGAQVYYLEASLTGKRDTKNTTGLLVRGYCTPSIVTSKWSMEPDGPDIRKKSTIDYGQDINLSLTTEGLNGQILIIEVYSRKLFADTYIHTYNNVACFNGEVSLKIRDTFSWFAKVKGDVETRDFYVKVKIAGREGYVKDIHNDEEHARFLQIKGRVYTRNTAGASNNNLPVKVGAADLNIKRYEPCSFTRLEVLEGSTPYLLFDEGKLGLKGVEKKDFSRSEAIYYEFNKWNITAAAKPVLNKLAKFLLESPYVPVELGSHTDIRGTDKYNMELSLKRAKSAVDYLIAQGVSASRITARGYGKTVPVIKGEKLTEEEHQLNRRTTIRFKIFENNAESIVFETIAPDVKKKKKLTIDIKDYTNKGCVHQPKHNASKVKVIELTALKDDVDPVYETPVNANQIKTEVYSSLSGIEPLPLQYIWPIRNPANKFLYYINSCRYFADPKRASVAITAYPDIKWDFHFFLNLSNKLSVKWQKLSAEDHKKMQSEAGKIGAEKRWSQTEIDFGVMFKVQWNKEGSTYGSKVDATLKQKAKIKALYNIFGSLKEFSKAITDTTKGKISKTRLGKVLPFTLTMEPPNFCMGAEWWLERGQKEHLKINEIGTSVKFYFKADPLIGITLNIDLLAAAVSAIGTAAGNPQAGMIFNDVRAWLAEDGHAITFKMYIDLLLTGTIQGAADITFNTASSKPKLDASIDATLSAEIQAGLEIEGKVVVIGVEAYAKGHMKATGKASITFGHGLKYDDFGMYYRPKLMFDGLVVTFVIKADVGISIKRGIFKGNKNINLADYDKKATLIPEFDVIKNLENYAGVSANIPLFKESN